MPYPENHLLPSTHQPNISPSHTPVQKVTTATSRGREHNVLRDTPLQRRLRHTHTVNSDRWREFITFWKESENGLVLSPFCGRTSENEGQYRYLTRKFHWTIKHTKSSMYSFHNSLYSFVARLYNECLCKLSFSILIYSLHEWSRVERGPFNLIKISNCKKPYEIIIKST